MRYMFSAIVLVFTIIIAGESSAADARVRAACTNDYLAYCSQHDPDGAGVRQCMRANGSRLSAGCVNALIAAGEVQGPVLARQMKTKRASSKEVSDD